MPGLFPISLLFIALLLPCQSVPTIVTNRQRFISRAAVQKQFPAKFFNDIDQSIARRIYLAERQSNNKTNSTSEQATEKPKPKGFNFDPCSYHRDCFGGRYCIRADFGGSCSGATSCICMSKMLQVCNIKCNECENYPDETCTYLPDDEKKGNNNGTCASSFVVYEGILVERGCNSFPDLTPLPAVEQPVVDWTLPGNSNTAPYSSGSNNDDSAAPSHPVSPQVGGDDNEGTAPDTNLHTAPYSSGSTPSGTQTVPADSHSPSPSVSPQRGDDNSKEMRSAPGDGGEGCIDAKALAHHSTTSTVRKLLSSVPPSVL